jgi:hypothetical protein
MVDPATALAGVATNVLVESVKWLFTKAGDALKRWRDLHDAKTTEPSHPIDKGPSDIFEGEVSDLSVDTAAVERLEQEIKDLRRVLGDYVDGIEEIRPDDPELLETADGLRRMLEAVYHQRITFKGEDRPPSGPIVEGTVNVEDVQGHAAAVKARLISSGRIRGEATATRVEQGGELYGVEVEEIE